MDRWIDDYIGGWNDAETIVLRIIDNSIVLTHCAFYVSLVFSKILNDLISGNFSSC